MLTDAARPLSLSGTEQGLSEPQREALLANAARPVQQNACGEAPATDGLAKALS
jgi:hypothetical protein